MSDMWKSSTPLSNQDFRKLLATPRPTDTPLSAGFAARGGRSKPTPKSRSSDGDDKPRKPFKKPPPKFAEKAEEGEDEGPKYRWDGAAHRAHAPRTRPPPQHAGPSSHVQAAQQQCAALRTRRDRAKERREGVGTTLESDAGISALTVEESKYLGGDVDHTHLVKGLDYALLRQARGLAWLGLAWHGAHPQLRSSRLQLPPGARPPACRRRSAPAAPPPPPPPPHPGRTGTAAPPPTRCRSASSWRSSSPARGQRTQRRRPPLDRRASTRQT
jgi:IK cytokine